VRARSRQRRQAVAPGRTSGPTTPLPSRTCATRCGLRRSCASVRSSRGSRPVGASTTRSGERCAARRPPGHPAASRSRAASPRLRPTSVTRSPPTPTSCGRAGASSRTSTAPTPAPASSAASGAPTRPPPTTVTHDPARRRTTDRPAVAAHQRERRDVAGEPLPLERRQPAQHSCRRCRRGPGRPREQVEQGARARRRAAPRPRPPRRPDRCRGCRRAAAAPRGSPGRGPASTAARVGGRPSWSVSGSRHSGVRRGRARVARGTSGRARDGGGRDARDSGTGAEGPSGAVHTVWTAPRAAAALPRCARLTQRGRPRVGSRPRGSVRVRPCRGSGSSWCCRPGTGPGPCAGRTR
jgi:hypothetical protein